MLAVVFVVLLALVAAGWGPLLRADARISASLHPVAVGHRGWTHLNRVLTDWAWDPWTMRLALVVAVLWAVWRQLRRTAVWLVVCAVLASVVQQSLKSAVGRARPVWPDPVDSAHYAAFPSGHAMTATVACGALLWLFLRRTSAGPAARTAAWVVAVVSVLGVGFTRVYLGVHWPTDVLGGWLAGGAVLAGALAACAPWRDLGERRPEQASPSAGPRA